MKIIDWHCDTILQLAELGEAACLRQNDLCVDIQKLKAAGSAAQFFALFIDMGEKRDPLEWALSMLDRFYQELDQNKENIQLARNYHEFLANDKSGKISAFLTIEEGGALKGQITNLRNFYRLGVRLITLTWNYPNEIGFPNCAKEYYTKGLTSFGREVVREMNRLGMIIDVSHMSDQGFYDVAKLSAKPFVASHSNARSVTNHRRNLTDDMIRILADKGGIMGLNFANSFLGTSPVSRIEDMVSHLKHIRNVGGAEVMALGTDFDGISSEVEINHIGEIAKLFQALKANGFSATELDKFCRLNAVRVIKECLQ